MKLLDMAMIISTRQVMLGSQNRGAAADRVENVPLVTVWRRRTELIVEKLQILRKLDYLERAREPIDDPMDSEAQAGSKERRLLTRVGIEHS
jgi:hypothetical protein